MKWYTKYLQVYEKPFADAPQAVIDEVRNKLAKLQSTQPVITVSLIGYNEEKRLLACLWSLSEMKCKYPVEIIGVDNESTDRTAEIYQATGVPYHTESQHSCGFARLCGLNNARGKYHINIDSDTLYPPYYVETMVKALKYRLDYDVDSVFLSNFYINWEATDSLDRLVYMTLPVNVVDEEARICGCYSLYNKESVEACKENLFSTLIGYGDFDAI